MRPGSVAALSILVGWLALAALASHPPPRAPAAATAPAASKLNGHSAELPSAAALIAMRAGEPIDLNAATRADLELLPGVGPRLAERIVAARAQRGAFTSLADLQAVSGIGPAKLERIATAACVGAGCAKAAQRSNVTTTDSVLSK